MAERIYRKLGIADLQMVVNMKREAKALDIWEIDGESARHFLQNPMNCLFACIDNGKIIGYACGHELNRLDAAGNMLYIHGVGVHADYRQQGIGRQMMTGIKQYCKRSGICKLFLFTHKTNLPACSLYEAVGGKTGSDDDVSYFFSMLD